MAMCIQYSALRHGKLPQSTISTGEDREGGESDAGGRSKSCDTFRLTNFSVGDCMIHAVMRLSRRIVADSASCTLRTSRERARVSKVACVSVYARGCVCE